MFFSFCLDKLNNTLDVLNFMRVTKSSELTDFDLGVGIVCTGWIF